MEHAKRATELSKAVVGLNFSDGEFKDPNDRRSQLDPPDLLKKCIRENEQETDNGAPVETVEEQYLSELSGDVTPNNFEGELEKLRRKGEVYEQRHGYLRLT